MYHRLAYRTRLLNYYESLTDDVDKRCMRSRWRAKRMTCRDKRVEALMIAAKNNCSRDVSSKVIKGARSLITLRSLTETSVSFQDENKNYATTSSRETTGSYDNEKNGFRDFLGNHRISPLSEDAFPKHSVAATDDIDLFYDIETTIPYARKDSDDILHRLSVYDKDVGASTTTQRPTFLNVSAVDDDTTLATLESRTSKYVGSSDCDMTPNNNQLVVVDLQRRNANNLARKTSNYSDDDDTTVDRLRRESDLTTPMSCTTDDNNFASLVQSPSSDTRDTDTTDIQEDDSRLREAPFPSTRADSTAASPSVTTAAAAPPLSVADVEIIDHTSLQAYLEKSIRIPLNVQSRLVNNAVIKYFLKENNLLLHLHSLRSYFFLLNGEFAKSLTDSLYARLYDISTPIELFNSATLTNLLERALVNSFNNVYVNSELLSLSATDTPAQLHVSFYIFLSSNRIEIASFETKQPRIY